MIAIFYPKKPNVLITNIIFDLIVGVFFTYYLMITPGLSGTIRFLLIALAAYDFTDIVYSINVLRKIRSNK